MEIEGLRNAESVKEAIMLGDLWDVEPMLVISECIVFVECKYKRKAVWECTKVSEVNLSQFIFGSSTT